MRLAGKVAIVTGGARGIGRATVEKMLAEGAAVAFLDYDENTGRATASELANRGRVTFTHADVTNSAAVGSAIEAAAAEFGKIDILVNNAGINAYYVAEDMTDEQWEHVFSVDLKGAFLCVRQVLPHLRAAGGGAIVNVASIHAFMTTEKMFPYAAAKSGLVGMTRSLALDYGPENIRVNAICPGWTRTHLVQEWMELQPDPKAAEASVFAVHPLRRIATPDEIANVIAFLASDEASFMTGAAVMVDGGLSARFAS